jgi:GNAT superfamily N-acetyltransferase
MVDDRALRFRQEYRAPVSRPLAPTPSPLDALGRNYLRGSEQQVRRQADEGRGVLNFLNPVPSVTSAVAEGRAPRFSDVALDAGLLAAGFVPFGKALQGLSFVNRGSRNVAEPDVNYIEAVLPEAQRVNPEDAVGYMKLGPDGTVRQVFVEPEFRRQGVATEMWNYANRQGLNPAHSPVADQTAAGRAWVNSLNTPRPGLTVTGVGDAGRLSALIRRLNKSEDVGDFITPETMRNAARPNEGREGLYRPGAETFDYKNVPEPASPYTFGLVETEKLAPMREFDRMAAPAGLGAVGPDNVQKLMDHMAQGGKLSDPVALAWYMDPKFAYLAEGNHRLAMAEQLGLEKLPATVWRQEYGAPPMGKFLGKDDRSEIYGPVGQRLEIDRGQLMREPWEEALYVPPTMHPYLFPSLRPNNTTR